MHKIVAQKGMNEINEKQTIIIYYTGDSYK